MEEVGEMEEEEEKEEVEDEVVVAEAMNAEDRVGWRGRSRGGREGGR